MNVASGTLLESSGLLILLFLKSLGDWNRLREWELRSRSFSDKRGTAGCCCYGHQTAVALHSAPIP